MNTSDWGNKTIVTARLDSVEGSHQSSQMPTVHSRHERKNRLVLFAMPCDGRGFSFQFCRFLAELAKRTDRIEYIAVLMRKTMGWGNRINRDMSSWCPFFCPTQPNVLFYWRARLLLMSGVVEHKIDFFQSLLNMRRQRGIKINTRVFLEKIQSCVSPASTQVRLFFRLSLSLPSTAFSLAFLFA